MAHIASVRSSTRTTHKSTDDQDQERKTSNLVDDISTDFSQMSVISMSSSECGDWLQSNQTGGEHVRSSNSEETPKRNNSKPNKPMMAPLARLETMADIEACVDSDLSQAHVLNYLEDRWRAISINFEEVLNHLQGCSSQVTEASTKCLEALSESIDLTCDKVDGETKALYHLMTTCDELTTKLSAANSFRDEIKTLRKSVETLENLYKHRPKTSIQRPPTSPRSP